MPTLKNKEIQDILAEDILTQREIEIEEDEDDEEETPDTGGFVGVFINYPAGDGYVKVNPERNQEGYYTQVEEVSFVNSDDLESAREEAEKILARLLANNLVAVFWNGPAGNGYIFDQPTGNFRGSGHHPYNCVREFPYTAGDEIGRAKAIAAAEEYLAKL